MLEAALTYADSGLLVHPCRPADKKPLTRWGTQATTDARTIRRWWKLWPDALIAVCTGGLVVVDVDPRNGGEQDHEACEETLTVVTRSGGWHHYYEGDGTVRNVIGLTPGVDIRGVGGYVIVPPSPGYRWLNEGAPVQPLPDAIAEAIKERERKQRAGGRGFEPAPPGSIGEGMRHDYMVRFAGWAIRVLEIDTLPELAQVCLEEYRRACSPADAPDRNIVRIARSILESDRRS